VTYEYRIVVYLAGDTPMQLCTVDTAEMAGAVVSMLCGVDHPGYGRLEIQIVPHASAH
jgi:hypothetical protein